MGDEGAGGIPRPISQAEIERLLILRQQAQEARTDAGKKQAELEAEEERLKAVLRAGTAVEPGPYLLVLATEPTARSVPWRKIVEQHLGRGFAEQILAATEPGERLTLRVLQEVPVDGAAAARGRKRGSRGEGEAQEAGRGEVLHLTQPITRNMTHNPQSITHNPHTTPGG